MAPIKTVVLLFGACCCGAIAIVGTRLCTAPPTCPSHVALCGAWLAHRAGWLPGWRSRWAWRCASQKHRLPWDLAQQWKLMLSPSPCTALLFSEPHGSCDARPLRLRRSPLTCMALQFSEPHAIL
eukprot:361252-Chlamydomonas_euryale.AAC.4